MRKGVTLIEILIVISILVILAVIFAMVFIGPAARARDSGRLYDSDRLRKNLEIYRSENDKYPESEDWIKLEEEDTGDPFYEAMITYLKNIPRDPLYGQVKDGKPYSFQYKTTDNGDCYKIHIEMEKRNPYEISGMCGSEIAYETGGSSPAPSGGASSSPAPSGGEDHASQVQNCVNNSVTHILWITCIEGVGCPAPPEPGGLHVFVDKVRVSGLANDCSGLLLTVIVSGNLPNDGCGVGGDPELGRASSIIPNDGDDENKTTVDFIPNLLIPPIECAQVEVT